MKLLILIVASLIALSSFSQEVTPRIGLTETSLVSAYRSSSAKRMTVSPQAAAKTKDRQIAFADKKYTDVYYIAPSTQKVESQHVVFNDTITRKAFILKLSAIGERLRDNVWKVKQGSTYVAAIFLIVMFNGIPKEAIVYRPFKDFTTPSK